VRFEMRNSESAASAGLRAGEPSLESSGPVGGSVEASPALLIRDRSGVDLGGTARRALITTVVAIAVIVVALALWKLKLVISLFFLAVIMAAAMRPGVEGLRRRGIPRGVGVLIHYIGLLALVALFLWLAVPRVLTQVEATVGNVPTSTAELEQSAKHSSGVKHQILVGIEKRLKRVPSGDGLFRPALSVTTKAFEILIGVFFVFACAAYWLFERDRTIDLVTSLIPRQKRKTVRDTWDLIDARLGAFVRGQLVLIVFVATVLSLVFWVIGEPYWILLGIFAGVFEIVPVIGPLLAGALAVGVGFTASWHVALAAGLTVLIVRLLEDYLILPRVLGRAVGLSPLLVLVSVFAVGILFGGFAVLLAIPIAAVLATLVDVVVRGKNPAQEDVPGVLFPAQDAEGAKDSG
jgi:predicted PurR-regulated permease PerM